MRIFYILCISFIYSCTNIDESFYIEDVEETVEIEEETVEIEDETVEIEKDTVEFPDLSTIPDISKVLVKTQCNTFCKTNEDCALWNGFCIVISDGYQVRSLCTFDCNDSKECLEDGFFCIPFINSNTGLTFNWQCVPIEGPICQGDK